MANKNIKEVEGGEVVTLGDDDGLEIDTGASSVWIKWSSLKTLNARAIMAILPDGMMLNGKISPTVSSNDLILTLLTNSGGTPSATDPVYIKINGTVRSVTSALSVTVADGTSTFNAGSAELGTKTIYYTAYAAYRTASTAVVLGFSRIPWGRLYSDFSGTATNEKYAAFSTAPASTDDCVPIGMFAATLSLVGTGHLWTVPTFTSANLFQTPQEFTPWMDWTPVPSASGSLTYTFGSITVARYKFGKNIMIREHSVSGTLGGTASNTVFLTAPFTAAQAANNLMSGLCNYANAITVMGPMYETVGPKFGGLRYDNGNFPNAGTLVWNAYGSCEV